MPPRPRVSVLVTSHNYREYIAEAIDSALGQGQPPDEIVILDDGSTDGSADFIRQRYRDEPRVKLHERPNRGQLASFVEGVRLASGDIMAFLDADDRWMPDYLEKVTAIYAERPRIDFVYTDLVFFGNRAGRFLQDGRSGEVGLSILLGAYSTEWQGSTTSALSLRREAALTVLDIPSHFFARWKSRADDWLVFGSDILGVRKYCLAEPLVQYRAHGNNAWLDGPSDRVATFLHWLKVEALRAHFRERAGLTCESKAHALRHTKLEFLTRSKPSRHELGIYLTLVDKSDLGWGKRFERKVSMWRHFMWPARTRKTKPGIYT